MEAARRREKKKTRAGNGREGLVSTRKGEKGGAGATRREKGDGKARTYANMRRIQPLVPAFVRSFGSL